MKGNVMKIRFIKDSEIEVVTDYDKENDVVVTEDEFFKSGEETEIDILADHGDIVDVQFGCGDCCYGLKKSCFYIIEEDEDEGYPDYYNDMRQDQ
jgi:hypothetical protein